MITVEQRQSASYKSVSGRPLPFYRDAEPVRKCGPKMLLRLLYHLCWVNYGHCVIQDRDDPDKIGPLKPRSAQLKMAEKMLEQASRKRKIRQNTPKSRRHGASTWAQSLFEFLCEICLSRNALTVAHSEDQVKAIFAIALRIAQGADKAKPSSRAERNIVFENTDSRYQCMSGLANYAGSGSTIHYLHISEYGKFENTSGQDKTALRSMINAMSQASLDTIVIIESSGEGPEGDWVDRVYAAEEAGDGENEFVNVFLPWTDDPANTADPDEVPEDFPDRLGKYEQGLLSRGLTLEQIYWRNRKIRSEYPGENPGEHSIEFGYDWPLELHDLFGVKQGLVYPMLRRDTHEREVKFSDLSPRAYAIRVVDWGSTKENPFAVGFYFVDPVRHPGFTASKKCVNFWKEASLYGYQKGRPIDKWNHLLDGLRMLATTRQLDCYVHLYKEIYFDDFDDPESGLSDLARLVHRESGWEHPFESNRESPQWQDLRLYRPREDAIRFETGIGDRSGKDRISLFNRWGIPLTAHTKMEGRESRLSEIEDGIAVVANLMRGTIATPLGPTPVNDVLESALRKASDPFRARMMTPAEESAYKQAIEDARVSSFGNIDDNESPYMGPADNHFFVT